MLKTAPFLATIAAVSVTGCAARLPMPGRASDYVVVTPPDSSWEMKVEKVYYMDHDPSDVVTLHRPSGNSEITVAVYPKETNAERLIASELIHYRHLAGFRTSAITTCDMDARWKWFFYSFVDKDGESNLGMVVVRPLVGAKKGMLVLTSGGPVKYGMSSVVAFQAVVDSIRPKTIQH